MLSNKYAKMIYNSLLPEELIRPYPSAANRDKWVKIGKGPGNIIHKRFVSFKGKENKQLTGTMIVDAAVSGNSECVTAVYDFMRNKLTALALCECLEGNGMYIEDILDAVWSFCDMAIWHDPAGKEGDFLSPVIDRYSAETGFLLTYVWYLFRESFNKIDTNIRSRFRYEITKRIMIPFMNDAYNPPAELLGEIILPFLLLEEDYAVRQAAVRKTLDIADKHLRINGTSRYPEVMYMATDGVFDMFSGNHTVPGEGIQLLQYIMHNPDKKLLEKAFGKNSGREYLDMLALDIPIDRSLFIIFNHDLIANAFYFEEAADAD